MAEKRGILLVLPGSLLVVLMACAWLPSPSRGGVYFAEVDRVEPEIPGLIVEGTRAVVGEITITNETGKDIYIVKRGTRKSKITPSEVLHKDKDGQWVHLRSSNVMALGGRRISYYDFVEGVPRGERNGQVMKEWVVHGRVDDTPFKIIGKTVYYLHLPPTPTRTPEPAKE